MQRTTPSGRIRYRPPVLQTIRSDFVDSLTAPNVLEIRKAWFQVACNTDMKERNVATDGHSPNVMIMFSRLDDLPYSLTYGATLQALR